MRHVHLATGILFLAIFIASGQYMDLAHDHLRGMAEGPRLLYRSAHIYLLFLALLNVVLGCYLTLHPGRRAQMLQIAGSVIVLATPVFMTWSFFAESQAESLARPVAVLTLYATLLGVGLHFFSGFVRKET